MAKKTAEKRGEIICFPDYSVSFRSTEDDPKCLKQLAEYHQKNGIDPIEIYIICLRAGFKKVKIIYNYPENPDLFTKILMFLNKFLKSNSFYYYFSIIAQK